MPLDPEKRKLIVREIENWRRSKLLPEQYCDFLLNLYLDDPADRDKHLMGMSAKSIANSHWKIWMAVFGGAAVISFLVLHFNLFPFPMQIALLALTVLICYGWGLSRIEKTPAAAYGLTGLGCLILFGGGVYVLRHEAMTDPLSILAFLAFCFIVWIAVGIATGMGLFHFCGWVGLMLGYAWLLQGQPETMTWAGAQLSWLPFCALFGWLGWLLQHKRKSQGLVFLLLSVLLWLVPEIYGIVARGFVEPVFQGSFLVKLIVAGAALFGFRKKWIEWVA